MPHDSLTAYLKEVEQSVGALENAYVEHYSEEILTPERANLRIRIRFVHGHLLEINEALVVEKDTLQSLDYRYHYQDTQNRLIFRYDSTPHFPNTVKLREKASFRQGMPEPRGHGWCC